MEWLAIALIGTQFVGWLITRNLQSQIYQIQRSLNALLLERLNK